MGIKERLIKFSKLLREIEIEEKRQNAVAEHCGYNGRRALESIIKRLDYLYITEKNERTELSAIIEALPCAEQRQVLFARYFDGFNWNDVTDIIFSNSKDYEEKKESYQRRIYRIHGNALANADKIIRVHKND